MRRLIRDHFLPADYEQHLFAQFLKCKQGNRNVSDYSCEFMRLLAHSEVAESTDGKDLSSLKVSGSGSSFVDVKTSL